MTRQCLHRESVPGGGREGPLRRSGHSGRQLDRGRRGEMGSGAPGGGHRAEQGAARLRLSSEQGPRP